MDTTFLQYQVFSAQCMLCVRINASGKWSYRYQRSQGADVPGPGAGGVEEALLVHRPMFAAVEPLEGHADWPCFCGRLCTSLTCASWTTYPEVHPVLQRGAPAPEPPPDATGEVEAMVRVPDFALRDTRGDIYHRGAYQRSGGNCRYGPEGLAGQEELSLFLAACCGLMRPSDQWMAAAVRKGPHPLSDMWNTASFRGQAVESLLQTASELGGAGDPSSGVSQKMSWSNKRSWDDDWKGGSSWKDDGYKSKGAYWGDQKRSRGDDWSKDSGSGYRNGNSWGGGGGGGRRGRDREPYKTKEELDADLEKYFGREPPAASGENKMDADLDKYMGRGDKASAEETPADEAKEKKEDETEKAEDAEMEKEKEDAA
eukprot:s3278_g5.t1